MYRLWRKRNVVNINLFKKTYSPKHYEDLVKDLINVVGAKSGVNTIYLRKISRFIPNYYTSAHHLTGFSSIHNMKEECFIHLSLPQSHKVLNNKTFWFYLWYSKRDHQSHNECLQFIPFIYTYTTNIPN